MPRKSLVSAKRNNFSNRLLRIGHTNIAIVAAFVLVFAGLGTLFVTRSEAATWSCAAHYYYEYEPVTHGGYCVKNIQDELDYVNNAGLTVDGIYGPATEEAVQAFGNKHGFNNSGQVRQLTWGLLCGEATSVGLYSADSCAPAMSYANYGRYPVN